MAELPTKLRIGHVDVEVEIWNHLWAQDANRWGEWSTREMKIRIDTTGRQPIEILCTLMHEVLHAICWAYEVRFVDTLDKGDHPDTEERMVGILSGALAQVYRDNPELVQFIVDTRANERD